MANIIVNKETNNATVTVDDTECCLVLGTDAYDVFVPDSLLNKDELPAQVEIVFLIQWMLDEHPEVLTQLKRAFISSQFDKMSVDDKLKLFEKMLQ